MAHSILDSLYGELSEAKFRWNEIGLEKRRLLEGTVEWLIRDFGEECSLNVCLNAICKTAQYDVLDAIHWHIAKRFAENAEGHDSYRSLRREIKKRTHDSDIDQYVHDYLKDKIFGLHA